MKTYDMIDALNEEIDELLHELFAANDNHPAYLARSDLQHRADERAEELRYRDGLK